MGKAIEINTENFFTNVYQHAESNAMLIMDSAGIILDVNAAFTKNYGYTSADLKGNSFKQLFTKSDKEKRLPEKELKKVNTAGQSNDDNYVVDKEGIPKLSSGESVLVSTAEGEKFIVKMIVNLHAKKYLRLFFSQTDKLLEKSLSGSNEVPMVILDRGMKVLEVNAPFRTLFELRKAPARGSTLSSLEHPFWKREDVKLLIRSTIVGDALLKRKRFELQLPKGIKKKITIDAKMMESASGRGKRVFIMIDETK